MTPSHLMIRSIEPAEMESPVGESGFASIRRGIWAIIARRGCVEGQPFVNLISRADRRLPDGRESGSLSLTSICSCVSEQDLRALAHLLKLAKPFDERSSGPVTQLLRRKLELTIERRTDERLHASLPARVAFGGRYRLRGVVLNISGTGAKLALDKSGDVPAEFVLSVCFKRQERHYKAKIQWRKREALGLGLRPLPAADSEWLQGLARTRHSEDACWKNAARVCCTWQTKASASRDIWILLDVPARGPLGVDAAVALTKNTRKIQAAGPYFRRALP
jgi:hypothetical protein